VPTGRPLRALLAASHPEPAALVTLLTVFLSLAGGRRWDVLWVAAAVGSGQLGVGWSNDFLDRDLDRAQGRLDKPLAAVAVLTPGAVRAAAAAALAACVPLSLAAGTGFAAAHLVAVALAIGYNVRLKVLPLSVVPYAAAFGLLPVAVALGLTPPRWPHGWAVAAAALIGAGGHFTQALPDIPADRRLGIRGLPQVIGQRAAAAAAAGLLLAASLTIAFGPGRAPGPVQLGGVASSAALAAGIVAAALGGRPRLAFRLTLAAASVSVAAFVAGGGAL
jgi:4-hydroxybenzoate polyprenyltransferase